MDKKLISIFREVFNDPDIQMSANTTAADVDSWDSFNHMNLIMSIEEEYNVSFTTQEIGQMGRVGDLVKLLEAKI
jgi:acyl carrier protein